MNMLSSEVPIRLADLPEYLGAVLVSSRTITSMEKFREGNLSCDVAFSHLEELRGYFRETNPCFLDYVQFVHKTNDENYKELMKKVASAFECAEKEIKIGKAGKGIEEIIALADNFGDVCLAQARHVY